MHDGPPRHPPAAAVQGNHWRSLPVGDLDAPGAHGRPTVSVVVPVRTPGGPLPWVLASLEAQRYPAERLEVLVTGWDGAILPEPLTAPGGTPVIALSDHHGTVRSLGAARNRGIDRASGDVVLLLGAQAVAHPGLVGAHARWHCAARDLLVVGALHRIEPDALADVDAPDEDVLALLEHADAAPVPWWEALLEETEDLSRPGAERTRAVVPANASIRRDHLRALGGFAEPDLRREPAASDEAEAALHPDGSGTAVCEDRELAWRAITEGTVVVPDRAARAWTPAPGLHAGEPGPSSPEERLWLADRVPSPSLRPARVGRAVPVPRAVVELDATGADPESVLATVDAALTGDLADVTVVVRGDADRGARRVRESLHDEPRVLLGEAEPPPAPLTVTLDTPIPLQRDSLQGLFDDLVTHERAGVLRLTAPLDDTEEAPETTVLAWSRRAVRTAARVAQDRAGSASAAPAWEHVLEVAEELFGGGWESGSERGIGHGHRWRPTAVSERQLDALQRAQQREERLEARLAKRDRRIRRLERELEEAQARAEHSEERLARLEGRRVVRALRRIDRMRRGDG